MPVRLDSCTARRRTMHSPPLDAAELRLYCADGHDPDTYTSIYTTMRFSSDAPRSPALWALRTLLTGEAKPALDRRRVAAPSSTQPASPPSERCQTSAATLASAPSHTRVDRPTAPSDPALCPPGCALELVVAGVNEPGGAVQTAEPAKNGLAGRSAGRLVARALQDEVGPAEHMGG